MDTIGDLNLALKCNVVVCSNSNIEYRKYICHQPQCLKVEYSDLRTDL